MLVNVTSAILAMSKPWADSSTICARRQVTTDPEDRRCVGDEVCDEVDAVFDRDRVVEQGRRALDLAGARHVVTEEEALDEQTLHGKAPAGVATAAATAGVPV